MSVRKVRESDLRENAAFLGPIPRDLWDWLVEQGPWEGFLPGGAYLAVWPLDEWWELNHAYRRAGLSPNAVLIGSNGSDTGYGFEDHEGRMRFFARAFLDLDQPPDLVADSWQGFLEELRQRSN